MVCNDMSDSINPLFAMAVCRPSLDAPVATSPKLQQWVPFLLGSSIHVDPW